MKPINAPERWIWYAMIGTYGFWLMGGLYIVGSVLGWVLLVYLIRQWWRQTPQTPPDQRLTIPWVVWVWVGGMVLMEVALIAGHLDFNLGVGLLIKSSIGWAKGWALLALFPLVSCLPIRPQLLYRAACIIGLQTLILFPFFLLAYLLRFPEVPYVSPLKIVGGPGPEFFALNLYEIDPSNGLPRWRLFTPWAPALGMMGNIYFFLAMQETNRFWKLAGMVGAVFMCVVSVSRLAIVAIVAVLVFNWLLSQARQFWVWLGAGLVSLVGGWMAPTLWNALETAQDRFRGARENSSRVREALGRIALDRWSQEAPIWGHGVVEPGPHLVEFMPIGSHHTWYGLLYVKGIVGSFALAIPILCSFGDLLCKAPSCRTAQIGLSMLLILCFYTLGENLEILAYLFWPALIILGIAHQSSVSHEAQNFTYLTRQTDGRSHL
jgi:hypothetical protein